MTILTNPSAFTGLASSDAITVRSRHDRWDVIVALSRRTLCLRVDRDSRTFPIDLQVTAMLSEADASTLCNALATAQHLVEFGDDATDISRVLVVLDDQYDYDVLVRELAAVRSFRTQHVQIALDRNGEFHSDDVEQIMEDLRTLGFQTAGTTESVESPDEAFAACLLHDHIPNLTIALGAWSSEQIKQLKDGTASLNQHDFQCLVRVPAPNMTMRPNDVAIGGFAVGQHVTVRQMASARAFGVVEGKAGTLDDAVHVRYADGTLHQIEPTKLTRVRRT